MLQNKQDDSFLKKVKLHCYIFRVKINKNNVKDWVYHSYLVSDQTDGHHLFSSGQQYDLTYSKRVML